MDHRKLLMEILVMLARQEPDQGANLEIAGRAIDEHLARIGLSKEIQRSELEWIKKAIGERAKQDGNLSKFFEHIHDIIKTRLLQLDG